MSPTDYVVGVALFGAMLAGTLGGAWLLVRKRYAHLDGAPMVVAYGTLATLGVLAVHVGPLAFGAMNRVTVLVATGVWLVVGVLVRGQPAQPDAGRAPRPPGYDGPLTWGCTVLAASVLGFIALLTLGTYLTVAPAGPDQLNFHMPTVAGWVQTGSLWQAESYLPDVLPGHYTNNGDVLVLASVLPWDSDFLSHLVMPPFWVLTGVAIYALAREAGIDRAAACLSGVVVMAIPAVSVPAIGGGLVDTVMLFGFAAGLLFLARHHRTGRASDLVLAGLVLGLSFGTKWYAVSSVAVVVAVWMVARGWARRRWGELAAQTAAVTGLIMLTGGIWLLRNLVESGNPFMPVKVSLLGLTIFDAPPDRIRSLGGFTIADYAGDPGVWQEYILPQLRDAVAAPAVLVLAGSVLACLALVLSRRRGVQTPSPGYALAGVVMVVLLGLVYSITPYTAGGPEGQPVLVGADARYLVPTLLVAAVVTAWGFGRVRYGPQVFAVLGSIAALDGAFQLGRAVDPGGGVATVAGATLVTAGVGAAIVARTRGSGWAPAWLRVPLVAAAIAFVALLAVVAAGRTLEEEYMAKRYYGRDLVADTLSARVQSGSRVGLAGVWSDEGLAPPLLAFGPRLRNHVGYVGRDDDDVLRRFRTQAGFQRELRRRRYGWLVVGRGRPPKPSVNEERWAQAAGFRIEAQSDRLTLLRKTSG